MCRQVVYKRARDDATFQGSFSWRANQALACERSIVAQFEFGLVLRAARPLCLSGIKQILMGA